MTLERKSQLGRGPEQLRLPTKLRVKEGDVVELITTQGMIRVSVGSNLQVETETIKFERENVAKQRALVALERPLAGYINACLTETGSQVVDPQSSINAQVDRQQREEALKKIFSSLLSQGLEPREIEQEIRAHVEGKARFESHMGIIHPVVRNVVTDLKQLLEGIAKEREKRPVQRKR